MNKSATIKTKMLDNFSLRKELVDYLRLQYRVGYSRQDRLYRALFELEADELADPHKVYNIAVSVSGPENLPRDMRVVVPKLNEILRSTPDADMLEDFHSNGIFFDPSWLEKPPSSRGTPPHQEAHNFNEMHFNMPYARLSVAFHRSGSSISLNFKFLTTDRTNIIRNPHWRWFEQKLNALHLEKSRGGDSIVQPEMGLIALI